MKKKKLFSYFNDDNNISSHLCTKAGIILLTKSFTKNYIKKLILPRNNELLNCSIALTFPYIVLIYHKTV